MQKKTKDLNNSNNVHTAHKQKQEIILYDLKEMRKSFNNFLKRTIVPFFSKFSFVNARRDGPLIKSKNKSIKIQFYFIFGKFILLKKKNTHRGFNQNNII